MLTHERDSPERCEEEQPAEDDPAVDPIDGGLDVEL